MYNEDEGMTEKIHKLGFEFFRDYGNEIYGDYLRHVSKMAHENGTLTKDEYYEITKFNNPNSGDILEAIMGYAVFYLYNKDPELQIFLDIRNHLENGIMKRR